MHFPVLLLVLSGLLTKPVNDGATWEQPIHATRVVAQINTNEFRMEINWVILVEGDERAVIGFNEFGEPVMLAIGDRAYMAVGDRIIGVEGVHPRVGLNLQGDTPEFRFLLVKRRPDRLPDTNLVTALTQDAKDWRHDPLLLRAVATIGEDSEVGVQWTRDGERRLVSLVDVHAQQRFGISVSDISRITRLETRPSRLSARVEAVGGLKVLMVPADDPAFGDAFRQMVDASDGPYRAAASSRLAEVVLPPDERRKSVTTE